MASTDTALKPSSGSPPENKGSIGPVAEVGLRFLLFATTLVAVIVMVTSKQTKLIPVPFLPGVSIPFVAKFSQSPAFIYFVAALSVACLYSIITGVISVLVLIKPGGYLTTLQFHFVTLDALLLGIVAAATGAAGGVGYIGYKGNTHMQWQKVSTGLRRILDALYGPRMDVTRADTRNQPKIIETRRKNKNKHQAVGYGHQPVAYGLPLS